MIKVNKLAHTHKHASKKQKFKERKQWLSVTIQVFEFFECSITSVLYMNFRTVMTKRIENPQVNAKGTCILLD